MLISNSERMLRLNLQFFGEGADGGTGGAAGGADTGAAGGAAGGTDAGTGTQVSEEERISKLVQSQVDRLMADERKKNAELQKKVDKMTKEKLSDEEIKKLEFEEKEKTLAEREKTLNQQKNLIYAQQAVTKAGFGEDLSAVVDFVMGDSEEKTDERVKNFKTLVDKIVAAQVDKTFKANGRTPNGAGSAQETKSDNSIAEKLGKAKAEQTKKSNDILSHYYTGGKK